MQSKWKSWSMFCAFLPVVQYSQGFLGHTITFPSSKQNPTSEDVWNILKSTCKELQDGSSENLSKKFNRSINKFLDTLTLYIVFFLLPQHGTFQTRITHSQNLTK